MEKALVLSVICIKCENKDNKTFKEEESIEILIILVSLKIYNYFKRMSQELRLKNIDQTRKYFLNEIKQNKLISRKHKKICTTLNYIKHVFIVASTVTGCIPTSAFPFLSWYSYRNYDICNRI